MKIEYHNLHTHFVLITRNRHPFIREEQHVRIEKYITGIIANHDPKLYAIYANPEHIHFLVSRSPKISEEALLARVADATHKFISDNRLWKGSFEWQDSASAFSVSKGDVDKVCKYIMNQPEQHKKTTFAQEYDDFVKFYQKTLKWQIS